MDLKQKGLELLELHHGLELLDWAGVNILLVTWGRDPPEQNQALTARNSGKMIVA